MATAAVDAFVALSHAGAFSSGTRDALDALAALDAAVPDLNALTGFAAIGHSSVLGAALALVHGHKIDAVLTSNDSIQRRVVERGLVVLGDREAPECLALACAALEAAPACFSGNLPNYEPPLRSAIVAAARALQRCVGAPHLVRADAVSATLAPRPWTTSSGWRSTRPICRLMTSPTCSARQHVTPRRRRSCAASHVVEQSK